MHEFLARVRTEQRRQWESGSRVLLESLLPSHAELTDAREHVLDLIYAEVLLREEFGEVTTAAEYASRFPEYASEIARLFEVHSALRSGPVGPENDPTPLPGVLSVRPEVPGYEIGSEIGRGAWGVVYEARQLSLDGRRVAIKIVRPDRVPEAARAALRRDAEAAARLAHPNITRIYDCGEHQGVLYVVLELIGGGTLADRLGDGPVPPVEAARLAEAIARAAHHAHAAGIVHRDLKPTNILLTSDGVPKVTDFGLAKRLDSISSVAPEGAIVGTWQYMAPEQAAGATQEVGPAADVWAIGALFHESLTGRPPFVSPDPVELLRQVRYDEPAAPARKLVPPDLDAIRLKCLEKRPADRYQSAAELAADLQRWLAGQPVTARPPSWRRRTWRALRRRPRAAAGLGTLLLAVVGSGGFECYRWYTDPLRQMSAELAAGMRVTAVGATGGPRWKRWRQGPADLTPFDESGVISFRAETLSVLELFPDPGHDRYRLTAELRQLSSNGQGAVGVFVGFDPSMIGGWQVNRWYGIEYTDLAHDGMPRGRRRIEGIDYVTVAQLVDHPAGLRRESRPGVWTKFYDAPDVSISRPPWRRIVVEVGPDRVRAEWGSPPGALEQLPDFVPTDRPEDRLRHHNIQLGEFVTLPPAPWKPRGGVGVYARKSQLALRNVVLEIMN